MSDKILFRRHGDVNLFPITQEEYEKANGKIMEHKGKYIIARGEATNSTHQVCVEDKNDLEIKEDGEVRFVKVLKSALVTHTHNHETIKLEPGFYRQVQERELDHFADSVQRKVVD